MNDGMGLLAPGAVELFPIDTNTATPLRGRGKVRAQYGIQARKGVAELCLSARRNPLQLPAISPRPRLERKRRTGA